MSTARALSIGFATAFFGSALAAGCGGDLQQPADLGADSGGAEAGPRCQLHFGVPETRAAIEGFPLGLVADASHVYWATSTEVKRIPKQGGNAETIASGSGIGGLTSEGADLLWYEESASGFAIRRWTKDGGKPITVLAAWPHPIDSVAASGAELYWLDLPKDLRYPMLSQPLEAHRFNGGQIETLGPITPGGNTSSLTVRNSALYFTSGNVEKMLTWFSEQHAYLLNKMRSVPEEHDG
jgi:hypothetical protein